MGGPDKSQALGISVVKQWGNQAHFLAFLLREELSGQVLGSQGRALNSETDWAGERRSPFQVSGLVGDAPWNTELGLSYLGSDHNVQKQLK